METRYAQFVRGRSIMVYHPNGSADPLDQVKPAVEARLKCRRLDPDQTKALLHTAYKNGADKMGACSFLTNSKLLYLKAWLIPGFSYNRSS